MKRYFLLAVLFLAFDARQASALVGGPFDNGSHNAQLENGIYQAVLTMRNGNGFCYFHPESQIVPADPAASSSFEPRGSVRNRAIIYYKGVTYVGSAFGMADPDGRYVQCSINGASEFGFTVTQQSTTATGGLLGGITSSNQTTVAGTVTSSARGFTVNGNWDAKIRDTSPTLKFVGKGELVFIAPSGPDSIAGLAYQGAAGLINAIINSVANAGQTGLGTIDPGLYASAQTAISNILGALPGQLAGAGLDATKEFGDVVKLKVRGTFRYL